MELSGKITFTNDDGENTVFTITNMNDVHSMINKVRRTSKLKSLTDQFIKDRVIVTGEYSDVVLGMTVYADFLAWARTKGCTMDTGRNGLYTAVRGLEGVTRVTGNNKIAFRGLTLKIIEDLKAQSSGDDLI